MANPPNRETSLPMASGSLAQVGTGANQGEKPTDIDAYLTMMGGSGPVVCEAPETGMGTSDSDADTY